MYTEQPKGYEAGRPSTVCLLNLALYGAKQAGNLWNGELHGTMTAAGAQLADADPNL